MRYVMLALAIMVFTSCASRSAVSPASGGYDLKVTNHHPDDVVVYLVKGGRKRLGRMGGLHAKETWHLSSAEVKSGPQIMVCVGNWTPTNRQCFTTGRMTGGYPGQWGQPGTVLLLIRRGIGGITAILNG